MRIFNALDRRDPSYRATVAPASSLAFVAPTWQPTLGANAWGPVLSRLEQYRQGWVVVASNRDDGTAGLHTVQLSGLWKPCRPPPPTNRPSLPVARGSTPYALRPLPPPCRRLG